MPGAPSVDPLDQLGLDPDVDICGFPFHTGEVGRCRAPLLDNSGQKIDRAACSVVIFGPVPTLTFCAYRFCPH
jgi:hypothetical protein